MNPSVTAFQGKRVLARGSLDEVTLRCREALRQDEHAQLLIFNDETGEQIDLSYRDKPAPAEEPRRPGRPKLGVVAREVTLLPQHWAWLAEQPGGASVALRKLVEHGMKANRHKDRVRRAQQATNRFLSAMAGNEPGFEETTRALFRGDGPAFRAEIAHWPADIRSYAGVLAAAAFAEES